MKKRESIKWVTYTSKPAYESYKYAFSILYPAEWEVKEEIFSEPTSFSHSDQIVVFYTNTKESSGIRDYVAVFTHILLAPIKKHEEYMKLLTETGIEDFNIISQGKKSIGKTEWYNYEANYAIDKETLQEQGLSTENQEKERKLKKYFTIKDNELVEIVITAERTIFPKIEKITEKMINSFKLIPIKRN